jgi:hypothetical protein
MNTQAQLKSRYQALYDRMAVSTDVNNMKTFGQVEQEMMGWMIEHYPEQAQEWIEKLEAINWNNYLTKREADKIVAAMEPRAPWSREQWQMAMQQHNFPLAEPPYYNMLALYVVMSMIYSDSIDTLTKYMGTGDTFQVIHSLAVDKLKDADKRFSVRRYFEL